MNHLGCEVSVLVGAGGPAVELCQTKAVGIPEGVASEYVTRLSARAWRRSPTWLPATRRWLVAYQRHPGGRYRVGTAPFRGW
jgi:hypothetical protein